VGYHNLGGSVTQLIDGPEKVDLKFLLFTKLWGWFHM
jgi:hypothetical protein